MNKYVCDFLVELKSMQDSDLAQWNRYDDLKSEIGTRMEQRQELMDLIESEIESFDGE